MRSKLIPVILTAAVTSLGTFFIAAKFYQPLGITNATTTSIPVHYAAYTGDAAPAGAVNLESAADASIKSVVHIKTTTKARTVVAQEQDIFGSIFGRQYYIPPQMGSGSGVVISGDGYIVTNNHVVANANEVTVTFNDRNTMQAKVIATDPATDIALLKVDEKNLAFMDFGNSDDVRVGQWVLAAGYPLTLDATVTAGIVSAKGRSLGINKTQAAGAIESFIQTDAAVNPGNSGGALVNTSGQLIGINSAIASVTGSYVGYSYAIPSNIVRKVVNDMLKYGTVQRGYLGVEYIDRSTVSPEQIAQLGLDKVDGVYVANVRQGGGAALAGLQKGDFIIQVNGVAVSTEPQLMEQVARYHPGDNVSITYSRNSKTYTTTVQLKNLKGTTDIVKNDNSALLLGASFRALTSEEKSKLRIDGGVLITDVGKGTLSRQTNIQKGFVITNINDVPVNTVNDLQQAVAQSNSMQIAGFYPGNPGNYYYGLNNIQGGSNEQ